MSIQKIKIQYCSLFPLIDFPEETGFCTFISKLIDTATTQIKVSGAYKRLNKKGQTSGHVIQTHIKKRKVLYIFHEENFDTSLIQLSDDVKIKDNYNNEEIYTECSISTELLANKKYKTTVTGFVLDEYNESCNISSDFVKSKNQFDINNEVNRIESTVYKPSYVGISDFTDGGSKSEFTLIVDELTDNIEIGDYLYFHANFNFDTMGLSSVKCISKTTEIITFEGSSEYTLFNAETEKQFTLNYEPAYSEDINVIATPLITYLYTDFIPNFDSETIAGGKLIEAAQNKKIVTEKTVTRTLVVPLVVIDSELWKIEQLYKADCIKFIYQDKNYIAFEVDNVLSKKTNNQLFGVKEYEFKMIYNKEVISRNH